jgi:tetratricopeptide (TPR) repeat protein
MTQTRYSVLMLAIILPACSGYQPPAPVYGGAVVDPYAKPAYPDQSHSPHDSKNNIVQPSLPASTVETPSAPPPSRYSTSRQQTLSPAAVALMTESRRYSRAGDLEAAVVRLERALRISPRNAEITYQLAKLRLQQEKPVLAEDLAKKAALLAAGNNRLKRQCWLLISQSRRMQHDLQGAREAELKARQYD